MLSRLAIVGCVLLALAGGCSVESGSGGRRRAPTDGGFVGNPPGDDEDGRSTLTIVGDNVLPLSFAESVELVVLFENGDGEPESGQSIAFDMVGRPEDSSLSQLAVKTNSEGKASVTLRAATRPVAFEVEASNGRARPISFSISVSGNGFGSLLVHAPYDGVRVVGERVVRSACDRRERERPSGRARLHGRSFRGRAGRRRSERCVRRSAARARP